MLKNSEIQYGSVAQALHWVLAALMIGIIAVGYYMGGLADDDPSRGTFYSLHKSTGILILALVIARITWRQFNRQPPLPESVLHWQKRTAHFVHWLLYGFMFAMPLSGWAMSSAAGKPIPFYGFFELPPLIPKGSSYGGLAHDFHVLAWWGLLALITVHIIGAFLHHFYYRDTTLKRMLP